MKLTSRAGARLPAYTSAIGKTLLASLDRTRRRGGLTAPSSTRLTDHTIVSVPALLEELERTRERGYGVDDEEFAIGLRCIAVPIRDLDGKVVAAISVSMPTPRYSRAAAANARTALAEAAEKATAVLGALAGMGAGCMSADRGRPADPPDRLDHGHAAAPAVARARRRCGALWDTGVAGTVARRGRAGARRARGGSAG